MSTSTDVIAQLVAAFRAADETGTLTSDSECAMTFELAPAEYDAIDGTAEHVIEHDSSGVLRTKVAYRSGLTHVRSSNQPIPARCIDVTTEGY
jgi:hypothetical protein